MAGKLYTVLNMAFNYIHTLEENSFKNQHFLLLETLDLSNCNISEIDSNAFTGLDRMDILSLASNSLNDLSEKVFEPLVDLKELYLQGNQLSRILPQTLLPLKKLLVLDASYNRIPDIDKETFTGLSSLKEIKFVGNVMRAFAPDTFNSLKNLQYLELQLLETSNEMSQLSSSTTKLTSCLCKRKTALDWCRGRKISCFVTCSYSHVNQYDEDSSLCIDILNGFSKTDATRNRTIATSDLPWAVVITTAVFVLLIMTLIILALVLHKSKTQTGDENYSVLIEFESRHCHITPTKFEDNNWALENENQEITQINLKPEK
jgi:Leucine-rich repeat (LRR) protein